MDEMEKIEKVQKLCDKTGATAEAARNALEQCQWDMFEAFLKLDQMKNAGEQKQNTQEEPFQRGTQQEGAYTEYNTAGTTDYQQSQYQNDQSINFGETLGKCVKWIGNLIQSGMKNYLDVERDGKSSVCIPITIFVLAFLFFHVFVIGILIVGLFCGFRYSFSGPAFTKGADYEDKNSSGGR